MITAARAGFARVQLLILFSKSIIAFLLPRTIQRTDPRAKSFPQKHKGLNHPEQGTYVWARKKMERNRSRTTTKAS